MALRKPQGARVPHLRARGQAKGPEDRHRWRRPLPVLRGPRVTLREVRHADAVPLLRMVADLEVQRYVPPGPHTIDGFRQFITWVRRQRRVGRYLCFTAVDTEGHVAGLFQIWPLEAGFGTAEWGFVVAREYWGTGVFAESARMLIEFAFRSLAVRRLECRAAAANRPARAALLRLGGGEEGRLRECFNCADGPEDFVLHALLARDWAAGPPGASLIRVEACAG